MDSDHDHVYNITLCMRLENLTTPNLYNQDFLVFPKTCAFVRDGRIAFKPLAVGLRKYLGPKISIIDLQICSTNRQEVVSPIKDVRNSVVCQLTNYEVIMEYLVNISKRHAFWSLNEDILKINNSDNEYAVSIKEDKEFHLAAPTKYDKDQAQFAVSRGAQYRRRHFKTLSLDELKSPGFNSFSDQEYSEEEVAKTMAKTIEQYMSKTRADYGSGVARSRSTKTSDGLAAIQAQLNNLGREIKKVNEKVYAAQVGCEQCKGPHYTKDCLLKEKGKTLKEAYYTQFGRPFQGGEYRAATPGFYQRNNANPSYQERRQSIEDTLSKFMSKSAIRHEENFNLIKEIRALTDAAICNQGASIKTLEIQIGQMRKVLQERGFGSLPSSTEANLRDQVKLISTTIEANSCPMRRIGFSQYAVSTGQNLLEDMDAYRDEGIGDVIVGEPFLREVGIKARRFDGMITIYNGDDEVTYQMDPTLSEFRQWKNGSQAGTLACMRWNGPRERISTNIEGEFTNLEDLEVLES
ncbi:hypothetical protein Tco_0020594 [Tanacetum coccineum]